MIKRLYKSVVSERKRNELRYFLFKLRSPLYIGKNYFCNCCKKSFRKFLTYGNIPRLNALCPYCHSLERTRLLYFYLERETHISQGGYKILHFAPEKIIATSLKNTANQYISADINPALADHVIDITSIPYPNETFDFVICSHVLGHVPDESKAIEEIYRVLRHGGMAIILTVVDPLLEQTHENSFIETKEERLRQYGEPDLVRRHGKDFENRLLRSGIKVEKILYFLRFSEVERKKYSLGSGERETIFNCIKY